MTKVISLSSLEGRPHFPAIASHAYCGMSLIKLELTLQVFQHCPDTSLSTQQCAGNLDSHTYVQDSFRTCVYTYAIIEAPSGCMFVCLYVRDYIRYGNYLCMCE